MAQSAAPYNAQTVGKPFRLLDLPAELVLRVLDFAVVRSTKNNPLRISFSNSTSKDTAIDLYNGSDLEHRNLKLPAITRTCRLLRKEGLQKFLGSNTFYAHTSYSGTTALMGWVTMVCTPKTYLGRTIVTIWWCRPARSRLSEARKEFANEMRFLLNYSAPVKAYVLTQNSKVLIEATDDRQHYFVFFGTAEDRRASAPECVELSELQAMIRSGDGDDWYTLVDK